MEEKVEEIKEIKEEFDYRNVFINIKNLEDNKTLYHVGDNIEWNFLLSTEGLPENAGNINVIDEKTGMTVAFKLFNGNQTLNLGPFPASYEGKIDKTFRLFFFNKQSEMQFFGPKFGFSINVENGVEKKRLTNSFRIMINKRKKELNLSKETEYIIERLKEIGIS